MAGETGLTHDQTTHDDRSRAPAAAAAAATGVGAGYGAYHLHRHRDQDDKDAQRVRDQESVSHVPQGTSGQAQPPVHDTHASRDTAHSDRSNIPAAAAGAGVGGAGYNTYERHQREKEQHAQLHDQSQLPGATGTSQSTSVFQGPSHGGAYNVLPSGTESGVNDGTHSGSAAGTTAPSSLSQDRGNFQGTHGHDGAYNILPSGTDSGVNQDAHHGTGTSTTAPSSMAQDRSTGTTGQEKPGIGPYNVLSSGTASGVAQGNNNTIQSQHPRTNLTDSSYHQDPEDPGHTSGLSASKYGERGDLSHHGPLFSGGLAAATQAVAEGRKVNHSCSHCGQSDDISHYFKK